MVYIFKKLYDLSGSPTAENSQSSVVDSGIAPASQPEANSLQDPYRSTFRSPSKVFSANVGEKQGEIDTGLNKNLSQTRSNMQKSTDSYRSDLDSVAGNYKYNPNDLQNLSDASSFSRLSSLLNPNTQKSQLAGVASNTANYSPDVSGVAAASTLPGLSGILKNQYNTTAGGSRLDALLARGSGQIGQTLNKNLGDISTFKADQQNNLKNENSYLTNLNNQADQTANAIRNDASGVQNQLKSQAESKAAQENAAFNNRRGAANDSLKAMQSSFLQNQAKQQIQEAINKAFNGRTISQDVQTTPTVSPLQSYYLGGNSGGLNANDFAPIITQVDNTDQAKQNVLNQVLGGLDFSKVDTTPYIGAGAKNFDSSSFLDPRYNLISSLIGGNMAATGPVDTSVTPNTAGYSSALQNYLSSAYPGQVEQLVNTLFPSGGGGGSPPGIERVINGAGNAFNNTANKIADFGGW